MPMKRYLVYGLIALLAVLIAASGYLYHKVTTLEKNPDALAREEAEELVRKVGKFILLPEGETPTVATVTDPEKLADQPFFAKAKEGDKVLLYPVAKKAYLYDPVANRLLEVAPIRDSASASVQAVPLEGAVETPTP